MERFAWSIMESIVNTLLGMVQSTVLWTCRVLDELLVNDFTLPHRTTYYYPHLCGAIRRSSGSELRMGSSQSKRRTTARLSPVQPVLLSQLELASRAWLFSRHALCTPSPEPIVHDPSFDVNVKGGDKSIGLRQQRLQAISSNLQCQFRR